MHCFNCHGKDHNIRKCRHAPALNRRQQRARDRESSTSSRTSSSRLDDEESDLNSDDLQDLQFQAEMERYNAIIERAHIIAEKDRQCQEKEQDLESDSELSALANGLFNGMEGIEADSTESGDVEMGGTGSGPTDQDVQDDVQDVQDGQDGQDGGLEDVGSKVGDGKAILGAGTSPRCTRSGKWSNIVRNRL